MSPTQQLPLQSPPHPLTLFPHIQAAPPFGSEKKNQNPFDTVEPSPRSYFAKSNYLSSCFTVWGIPSIGAPAEKESSSVPPVFEVRSEAFSMTHKRHIVELASERELCVLRKENSLSTSWHYYAEDVKAVASRDSSDTETKSMQPRLLDIIIRGKMLGAKASLEFENRDVTSTCSTSKETLYFRTKTKLFSSGGTNGLVYYRAPKEEEGGIPIAQIAQEGLHLRTEYRFSVAPGVDPIVILTLIMAMEDREETNRQRNAAAAA